MMPKQRWKVAGLSAWKALQCGFGRHRWTRPHYVLTMFRNRADYRTHVVLNALWGTERLAYVGIGKQGGMLLRLRRCTLCRSIETMDLRVPWEDAVRLPSLRFRDSFSRQEFMAAAPWWRPAGR